MDRRQALIQLEIVLDNIGRLRAMTPITHPNYLAISCRLQRQETAALLLKNKWLVR